MLSHQAGDTAIAAASLPERKLQRYDKPGQVDQIAYQQKGTLPAFYPETSIGEQPYEDNGNEHHCHIDGGDAFDLQGTDGGCKPQYQ